MNSDRYFIVAALLLSVVVLCFFIPVYYAFAAIPVFVVLVIMMGNPRGIYWSYFLISLIYPLLRSNFSSLVRPLDKIVGVALFLVLFGELTFRRLPLSKFGAFFRIAFLLSIYAVVSFLFNRGSIRGYAQATLLYFSFIPFFIIGHRFLKERDIFIFIKGAIWLVWISALLNLGWRLGINPLENYHLSTWNLVDAWRGLFTACNFYAYFCSFAILFFASILSRNTHQLSRRLRGAIYVTILVLFLELFFTYTNHAYAILIVAFVPYVFLSGLWKKGQMILLTVTLLIAISFSFLFSEQIQQQFTSENLSFRVERLHYSAKVQLYEKVFIKNFEENPSEWFFGVGVGNGVGTVGKENLTEYALRMLIEFYQRDGRTQREETQMTSISGSTDAGYITLWGDLGLLGSLLYLGMYIWLFIRCLFVIREKNLFPLRRSIAEFLMFALVYLFLLNFLIDIFGKPFFAAMVWGLGAWLLGSASQEESKGGVPQEGLS